MAPLAADPERLEQLFVLALLAALAVSLAAWVALGGARASLRRAPPGVVGGVVALALVGGVARALWVAPAFLHTNFHGPTLVAAVLDFPRPSTFRAEYGQGSFVVLGALAALVGRTAEAVVRANLLLGALATLPLAAAAARVSGRPSAALYAAAAWTTSPLIARLSASEDAHVTALLFALTALALVDVAAAGGGGGPCGEPARARDGRAGARTAALVAGLVAAQLALWSRQTLYPFIPLLAGVYLERRWRAAGARGWRAPLALGAALLLAPTALRVVRTLHNPENLPLVVVYRMLAARPRLLLSLVATHPLLDVARLSPLVPVVGALGAVSLARRSPVRLSLGLAAAALVAATLPFGFPSPGVSWSFRAPLYALALLATGAGAAAVEAWLDARLPRRAAHFPRLLRPTLALAVAALGLAGRATAELRRPDPGFVEYVFVRDRLLALAPVTLVDPGLVEPAPSHQLAGALASLPGVTVVRSGEPRHGRALVVEGLGCHARSLRELVFGDAFAGTPAEHERLLAVALDPALHFGVDVAPRPVGARRECAALLAAGRPAPPDGPTLALADDPPMAIYDAPRLTLRLLELPPPP